MSEPKVKKRHFCPSGEHSFNCPSPQICHKGLNVTCVPCMLDPERAEKMARANWAAREKAKQKT